MKWGMTGLAFYSLGGAALAASLTKIKRRLELSRAKHGSITGHARLSRRLASFIPDYGTGDSEFFCSDGAPVEIATRRRGGFMRLAALYRTRFAVTAEQTAEVADSISDLQFTDAYRVPFQYNRFVRHHLRGGSFLKSSAGVTVTDLDGNTFCRPHRLLRRQPFRLRLLQAVPGKRRTTRRRAWSGAWRLPPGYRLQCAAVARDFGPRRGVVPYVRYRGGDASGKARPLPHRPVASGAICGSYHGWWGDVQPGIGNPIPAHETYTLKDMSEESLHVLRRRKNIACVLVNPLQALHPNMNAPGNSSLVDSGHAAQFNREAYTHWLRKLRMVCTEHRIVLIFDEVFVGFRLAPGGAQEYFGVKADMVVYGKTLGGGLPVGVVCGSKTLMKRFKGDRPADICFARGTFNSHPYVMGAMHEFLRYLETPEARTLTSNQDALWNGRVDRLNRRLAQESLPVRLANITSIWTVCYTQPARYNWMLQYYLRAEGLALSWVGSGRLIFSLNYTETDIEAVADRFVAAAKQMQADGWWWSKPGLTNKTIKRRILKEMIAHRLSALRDHRKSHPSVEA